MFVLKVESSFDAAHFLSNYAGKCANIHGHRWRVVALIKGETKNGMVVDFNVLKKDLKDLCDYFDHSFIVEIGSLDIKLVEQLEEKFLLRIVPFRTTAENFAKYFFDKLSEKYDTESVEVYETPTNCARYQKWM